MAVRNHHSLVQCPHTVSAVSLMWALNRQCHDLRYAAGHWMHLVYPVAPNRAPTHHLAQKKDGGFVLILAIFGRWAPMCFHQGASCLWHVHPSCTQYALGEDARIVHLSQGTVVPLSLLKFRKFQKWVISMWLNPKNTTNRNTFSSQREGQKRYPAGDVRVLHIIKNIEER